jgi:peptidoglycan/xylan/chitin deacetylase (PgdA/CDA1 family)
LKENHIKASFFLTGRFYSNPAFKTIIEELKGNGNYLGPHSNEHLLYCDWTKRDSLLVTKEQFVSDLGKNYRKIEHFGIPALSATYFLPPYEWYNDTIASWARQINLRLVNYTPGTISHADYTVPGEKNYRSSDSIYHSIVRYEASHPSGLNGFILLMHIGTDPKRTDKLYYRLPELLNWLKQKGYQPVRIDELLK